LYSSVTEIAEARRISERYVSRILRLALLAPDIVEAILAGHMERPLPASWEEQRRKIFPASDDLSSPRSPSLSDRQHLIRPLG
jgi:hypothetical protein